MKLTKKLLSLLLASALVLSLAACNKETGTETSDPGPGGAVTGENTENNKSTANTDGNTNTDTDTETNGDGEDTEKGKEDEKETESSKTYLIGISQYGEHSSLDNCRTGFLKGLEEAGLVRDKDFTVHYQNASFDDDIAAQIGQTFSAENVDLMVGIATPAATACYAAAEDKDIPVIFTAITDPVGAKLDSGNITGTSDLLPVAGQLELIRELQPEAKSIGIVYTTSEPNSVYSIGIYKDLVEDYGFTLETVGVTSQAEVIQAIDTLIARKVDCISNLTDNNVVGVLGAILEKTNEVAIPVYGSEVEQVRAGCIAAAGLDYVKLGEQTGRMAAKVLTGEVTCEELPYETIEEYDVYISSDELNAFGIPLSASLERLAIDVSSMPAA